MAEENQHNNFSEIGDSGLHRFNGIVDEEFLPQLQGDRKIRTYKEMRDNDPIIGAILMAIEMLVRQVKWRVEPFSQDENDLRMAEFMEENMMDMSNTWEDTIAEIMSMLVFGFSFHEIVYKRRLGESDDPKKRSRFNDGLIGWRKLPIRSQDTVFEWRFDESGGIQGMIQQAPPEFRLRFIPIEKGLLFRTSSHKNNPEGRSILRNAFRPWYFKKHIEEIEGIGIERDLAGLPVAFVPPELLQATASAEDRMVLSEIKKIIRNVRRDQQEGVIFPNMYDDAGNKMYDFQLMSTGGRRQFDTDAIIQRYDQRIAMSSLADFILLGHEAVGSFALSENKTNLFSVALGAWLDNIESVFNRIAIPRLFKLNGFDVDGLPQLKSGDIESVDINTISDVLQKLAGIGLPAFPDESLQQEIFRRLNLPTDQEKL